jgi:hypothetical protein
MSRHIQSSEIASGLPGIQRTYSSSKRMPCQFRALTDRMSGGDNPDLCDEDLECVLTKQAKDMKPKAAIMRRNIHVSKLLMASGKNWCRDLG